MATNVDNRVVNLTMNGADKFSDGANKASKALSSLKNTILEFGSNAASGALGNTLDNLISNGLGGLKNGVSEVSSKFSALETIAVGALLRIGSQAADTVERIVKGFTIDQLTKGFDKYEEKTSAVQTIMSATSTTWESTVDSLTKSEYLMNEIGFSEQQANKFLEIYNQRLDKGFTTSKAIKGLTTSGIFSGAEIDSARLNRLFTQLDKAEYAGTQMEFVNEQLEKLNWFSDETSYSFTDMTSNIGKFTAQQVPLNEAARAMQGISTWAALSGQHTQQASMAMYNLSQALGMGSVKLQDWKSIENANMGTAEFKQTAMETAAALGALEKQADGTYKTTNKTFGAIKSGVEVTVETFRETLSSGWFNKEVLLSTLQQYGGFADELYNITEKYDVTASKLLVEMDRYKQAGDDVVAKEKILKDVSSDLNINMSELSDIFEKLSSDEYDLGYRAFKAAQEAKTWSEVVEATNDAVSTGWMTTWELIFGNYEEAKVRFTTLANYFYDIFADAGNRRNAILKQWKDWGGSDALFGTGEIQGALWNILDTVQNIGSIISEAWFNVFGGKFTRAQESITTVANRLRHLTDNIREFTEKLKAATTLPDEVIDKVEKVTDVFGPLNKQAREAGDRGAKLSQTGEESLTIWDKLATVATRIKSIFRGVFAIFGIGKKILSAVFQAIKPLLSVFFDFGDGALSAAASLGDWLYNLEETIDQSEVFKSIMEGLSNAVGWVVDKFNTAKEAIAPFAEGILKKLNDRFSDLGNKIKNFNLLDFLDKVIETIRPIVKWIGERLTPVLERLRDFVRNIQFADILEFFVGMKTAMFGLDALKAGGGILGLIKTIQDVLSMFGQKSIDAKSILMVAIAVGILAASIVALSTIDVGNLVKAYAAMEAILNSFSLFIKGFSSAASSFKGKELKSMGKTATTLIKVSVAVLILAYACKILAQLDPVGLTAAVVAIGFILAELAGFAKLIDGGDVSKLKKLGGILIALSIAVLILTVSVKQLSKLSWEELGKGIAGVSALILVMMIFCKVVMDSIKTANKAKGISDSLNTFASLAGLAIGMIGLVVAISILAKVIKTLGEMEMNTLLQGGIAVIAIITVMSGALSLITNSKFGGSGGQLLAAGLAFLMIAATLKIVGGVIADLGELDTQKLLKGGITLSAMLVIIAGVIGVLTYFTMNSGGLLAAAASIMIVALSLKVIANAIQSLADIPFEKLLGIITAFVVMLAATMGVILAVSALGPVALAGAAAILIVSVAIEVFAVSTLIFAKAAQMLQDVKGAKIMANMLMISVGLLAIGVASVVLTLGAIGMVALAAALLALGAAVVMVGAGFALMGTGLQLLAQYSLSFSTSFADICQGIVNNGQNLLDALSTIILSLCLAITKNTTTIVTTIIRVLKQILIGIRTITADIIDTVIGVLLDLLQAIADNIDDFARLGVEIVYNFAIGIIQGISEKTGELMNEMVNLVISMINSFTEEIVNRQDEVNEALMNCIRAMIENGKKNRQEWVDFGKEIMSGWVQGIKDKWEELKDTVVGFFRAPKEAAEEELEVNSPSRVMRRIGNSVSEGFVLGITDGTGDVQSAMNEFNSAISSALDYIDTETSNPVISPVLDLSNVKSGVGQINGLFGSQSLGVASNISQSWQEGLARRMALEEYRANHGNQINIYPQNLSEAQIDYIYTRFNAKMGAALS